MQGASAYPRDWDYKTLRTIADSCEADIAHFSGLVAAQLLSNPFEVCDVVTTTTHKGPRAGLIFYRLPLKAQIDFAVFPSCQGGPHNNTIAAVAVALKQVATQEYKDYATLVQSNSRTLAKSLVEMGYVIATGGTDTHLVLWDLRPLSLTGSKMEKMCDHVGITLNKNSVSGDTSAFTPGAVRVGAAALTSRGFGNEDFVQVASFLDQACRLALAIQNEFTESVQSETKEGEKVRVMKLVEFCGMCAKDARVKKLKDEVNTFARGFEMFGFKSNEVPEQFRE